MKNPRIEDMKRRAKQFHRDQHGGSFKAGLTAYLGNSESVTGDRELWRDQVFIVNDYRVRLGWRHPRFAYYRLVFREAHRRLFQLWPELSHYLELSGDRQGFSVFPRQCLDWNTEPMQQVALQYFQWRSQLEQQVSTEVAFEVRPSMHANWYWWCKDLSLCVPCELRSEAQWQQILWLARALVKRETSITELYGSYCYGQEQWLSDCILSDGPSDILQVMGATQS